MVSAVERIEQDLGKMEEAIAYLASQLHDSYATYLTVLGQTVQKQLPEKIHPSTLTVVG
ncbi:hypothetical protein [Coleofasciculus sp.]|uniref:hypothetical protein n=1 Tax=Coleofasciculus sp. TaxID=3100458 RepID=UPI003A33A28C